MPCQIDEQSGRTLSQHLFFCMIKNDSSMKMYRRVEACLVGSTREARFVLKDLIALTKPRLLRLNVFAAIGGFWVASKWDFDWLKLLWVVYRLSDYDRFRLCY